MFSIFILLAQDNKADISSITQYLKAYGYWIVLEKNREETVAIAKVQQPQW